MTDTKDREVLVVLDSLYKAWARPPDDRWVIATWTLTRQNGGWLLAAYHNCPA